MRFYSVAMASDHRGYWLKYELASYFSSMGYQVTNYGTENDCVSVDYPDYAQKVAKHVLSQNNSFGILVCHSGIGMSIAANRFNNIRAVLCYEEEIAKLAREHNNANIICFGSGFISQDLAVRCATTFANTEFLDERHLIRIKKIDEF